VFVYQLYQRISVPIHGLLLLNQQFDVRVLLFRELNRLNALQFPLRKTKRSDLNTKISREKYLRDFSQVIHFVRFQFLANDFRIQFFHCYIDYSMLIVRFLILYIDLRHSKITRERFILGIPCFACSISLTRSLIVIVVD